MTIKTAKDLTSSLHGAAFRRATWDGRSWLLRSIKTLRALRYPERPPAVRRRPIWSRPDLSVGAPAPSPEAGARRSR